MKSSKWILGLTAIMLVLVLAPSSFAQVNVTVQNTASATEVFGNRLGHTSDPNSSGAGLTVSGALLATSTLTTTQIILVFPVNITSGAMALDGTMGTTSFQVPVGDGIQITGATGLFASITAVSSVQYAGTSTGGTITITLPGFGTTSNSLSGSFRIIGVRGDLTGKAVGSSAQTLNNIRLDNVGGSAGSGNANNYNLQTSGSGVTLVSAIGNGIGSFTQAATGTGTNNGTFTMFSNQSGGTFADSTATVTFAEGFVNAWKTVTQSSIGGTTSGYTATGIRLTVTGIPAGITVNVTLDPASTVTGSFSSLALTSTSTTSNITTLSFLTTQIAAVDSAGIQITVTGSPTGTLTPGTAITVVGTMASVAAATNGGLAAAGTPTSTGGVPRFDASNTAAVTIGNIIAAQTTMLIPYATVSGSTFDLAMAISNTTTDPFVTGSATKSAGILQFDFFPTTSAGAAGTKSTIITSASKLVGSGLTSTDGTLASGATWTGQLSTLLAAASPAVTGDFTGYIFIQANFLDAHGVYYLISKGLGTPGSINLTTLPIMVLSPPAATSRTNGGANAVESLGF